jgi:hypothetical protein
MVNKQSRSPGNIQRFEANARISDAPSIAVDTGASGRALEAIGAQLSARLGQMADRAAAREGEYAGLTAGQKAGVGFLQHQNGIIGADPPPQNSNGYDLSRHVPKGREAHLAGIRPEFSNALAAMIAAAPEDVRSQLTLNSGFRSNERQAELYKEALAKYGSEEKARKWVAPPGRSRHNHGDAYDLQYGSDSARAWVHANAGKFGLAFPMAHEPWHIELATARSPATSQSAAPSASTAQPLSTEPLALRRDGTIRGEAFSAAAMQAYSWRFQAGLTRDLGAAYEAHKDDPAGYARAANEVVDRYSQDSAVGGDPQAREAFDKLVYEKTEAARLDIAARQETRLRQEEISALGEGLTELQSDLERQSYSLGGNPAADDILAPQLQRAEASIANAVEKGLLTPKQAQDQRDALFRTVANGRIQGTFAALPTPAQKEAFALGLMDEWASGEGPIAEYSLDQVKALSNTLYSQARADMNRQSAEQKAEAAQLSTLIDDDLASMALNGQGLDFDQAGLSPDRVSALLGEDVAAKWQTARDMARDTWLATSGMETESPAEITDRLAALEPVEGQPGFSRQAQIYAAAQKKAGELIEERVTDPLGQAHRGGLVELAPIDASSGEALVSSLQLRRDQALQVANVYGTPINVFRSSERSALADALLDKPELLPGFAISIQNTFGDLAPRVLSELSEAGPELAHVAALQLATGDSGVATDIAQVLAGRRDKTQTIKMLSDAQMTTAAQSIIGPALGANSGTRAAVLNVADMLFQKQAAQLGLDPAEIKEPGSGAYIAYQNAIERALGARQVNGVKYGGLAMVNGRQVVAPTNMAADHIEGLLRDIRADDIAKLPPMATGNGVAIGAGDLAGAQLLSVGDGQYAVVLGDPSSLTPNMVQGPDGQPWILDMYQLDEVRRARLDPESGASLFTVPAFWRR